MFPAQRHFRTCDRALPEVISSKRDGGSWGLGFRVSGSGFRVQGLGLGFRVQGGSSATGFLDAFHEDKRLTCEKFEGDGPALAARLLMR